MNSSQEQIQNLTFSVDDLTAENASLEARISELEKFYDKIEKQKLSIIYQFNSWTIRDDLGVLATDKSLISALKKL